MNSNGWIPCSKRLPEPSEDKIYVLVWNEVGVDIAIFDKNLSVFFEYHAGYSGATATSNYVTHWQPLPSPPKEGE